MIETGFIIYWLNRPALPRLHIVTPAVYPRLVLKNVFRYKYPALPVEFQKIEIEILFQGDGGNRNTGELKESIYYTVLPRI